MFNVLLISMVVISILLSLLILVQGKDEGLSATFGGADSFQITRRGPEKIIFRATVLLAVLFLLNGLMFVFL